MKEIEEVNLDNGISSYKICALCTHMYNNKYYLSRIDKYTNTNKFVFYNVKFMSNELNNMFSFKFLNECKNENQSDFIFEFKNHIVDNNYQRTITNDFSISVGSPQENCNIHLTSYKYHYNFPSYSLVGISLYGGQNYIPYNAQKLTDEELDDIYKRQNNIVTKLKFFEENEEKLDREIREYLISKNCFDISFFNRIKKYIKDIDEFKMKYNHDEISTNIFEQLYDCFKNNMQIGQTYKLGLFSFENYSGTYNVRMSQKVYFHLLKHDSTQYKRIAKLFVPIFQKLGGVDTLKAIILKQRLINE